MAPASPCKPATAAVCQSSEPAIHNSCIAVLHDSSRIADSVELTTRAPLTHSCTVALGNGHAKLSTNRDVNASVGVVYYWLYTSVSSTRRYVLCLLVIIIAIIIKYMYALISVTVNIHRQMSYSLMIWRA